MQSEPRQLLEKEIFDRERRSSKARLVEEFENLLAIVGRLNTARSGTVCVSLAVSSDSASSTLLQASEQDEVSVYLFQAIGRLPFGAKHAVSSGHPRYGSTARQIVCDRFHRFVER